jgi:hypothetical protein
MGVSFLTIKEMQYKSAVFLERSVMAGLIAEAGMEDARIKLEKDFDFPPRGDEDQTLLAYSEPFYDMDGTTLIGHYAILIDISRKEPPYFIIRITSIGTVGDADAPLARRKIVAELDIPTIRGGSTTNPDFFRYINWQDSGSL